MYNLKEGIRGWQGLAAIGPPEMGLQDLRGDETAAEMAVIAYGLETGLRSFYLAMTSRAADPEAAEMFSRLAGYEALHREKVYALYAAETPGAEDRKSFEARADAENMEGGFTTDEFLAQHGPTVQTLPQILELALGIEAQALDLYLRMARTCTDSGAKRAAYQIGQEEKTHLAALGQMLGRKI